MSGSAMEAAEGNASAEAWSACRSRSCCSCWSRRYSCAGRNVDKGWGRSVGLASLHLLVFNPFLEIFICLFIIKLVGLVELVKHFLDSAIGVRVVLVIGTGVGGVE